MSAQLLTDDDHETAKRIVQQLKSQGVFDEFRRDCLSDVDTKPSFQNLRQRTEGYVSRFLSQQQWSASLNKNQLRESLRRQINESGMVKFGVEHLAEQVINPKVKTTFYPKIDSLVKQLLGIKDETDIVWPDEDDDIDNANTQNVQSDIKIKEEPIEDESMTNEEIVSDEKLTSSYNFSENFKGSENTYKETASGITVPVTVKSPLRAQQKESSISKNAEIVRKKTKTVIKQEIDEDYLSDVSSVHTSDLSDFDDRISLSSDDENICKEKVKISLEKVKKMTSVASVIQDTSTDDSDSNSKHSKTERKNSPKDKIGKCIAKISYSENNKNAGKLEQPVETIKPESQTEEPSEDIESNPKQRKKFVKQRSETHSQRYEASDLYKPRPVIPSRRNRTSHSDSTLS